MTDTDQLLEEYLEERLSSLYFHHLDRIDQAHIIRHLTETCAATYVTDVMPLPDAKGYLMMDCTVRCPHYGPERADYAEPGSISKLIAHLRYYADLETM